MLRIITVSLLITFLIGCEKSASNDATVSSAQPSIPQDPPEPSTPPRTDVAVTDLSFGSAINKYNVVDQRLRQFSPGAQVYGMVITDGSGPEAEITLSLKDAAGKLLYEKSQTVKPNGSWATAFNISQEVHLSPGEYTAIARLDGHKAETKSFLVK